MVVRFYAKLYILFAVFMISTATSQVCAEEAPASQKIGCGAALNAQAGSFGVMPEKDYFEGRSDIPLVEQFMKKWDAARRS